MHIESVIVKVFFTITFGNMFMAFANGCGPFSLKYFWLSNNIEPH